MNPESYTIDNDRLFIVSGIAVVRTPSGWATVDLWARDLNAQSELIPLKIFCPVEVELKTNLALLNPSIEIIDSHHYHSDESLRDMISLAAYVQLPGNDGWRASALSRRILKLARRIGRPVITGISSNRARTQLINQGHTGFFRRWMALARYLDIRFTQRWIAKRSAGVFVVGAGLVPLVQGVNANLHIGIASWISAEDIRPFGRPAVSSLRICMAGRLERMKGFHLGLEAVAKLAGDPPTTVSIIGEGPEKVGLQNLAGALGLEDFKMFDPVPYPGPFLKFLEGQDLVLLTNLNDEQPRLIFDAISRGCIPVCPDTAPYIELGLDPDILYRQGDANDLSERVRALGNIGLRAQLQQKLVELARRFTMQSMHEERLAWMRRTL